MSLLARVYVTHPKFRVTPTVRALSEPSLQVASDARTDPSNDAYFFFVDNDRESFERAVADDPTVADANRLSSFKGRQLYRLTYAESALLLSPAVTAQGGLIRDATARDDGWLFTLEAPSREALSAIWQYATDEDMTWEVVEVRSQSDAANEVPYGLTERQRETLLTAVEKGYFTEPREATLTDLADALDISKTAAGGRLRRGVETLIEATLQDEV